MVATLLITVVAFALLMGVMAIGVMASGKRLPGSCGGNPDSAHCGCSPAKREACRARAREEGNDFDADDLDVFSSRPVTEETLAPPGERRLLQLRTGRE